MKILYIVGGIVALAVLVSALAYFKPNSSAPAPNTAPDAEPLTSSAEIGGRVIRMTNDGFIPFSLAIRQGETVVFVNEDAQARWPASNIHPSHQLYSAFDPKRDIPSGEQWSFIFDQVGEWRFHDHLFPQLSGVIIVESTEEDAKLPNIKSVNELTNDLASLKDSLKNMGVRRAMDNLVKESGGGSVYDCHQQAHNIGRAGYAIEKEKVFSSCSAACHSGCYHGAMEIMLQEKGTVNLSSTIKEVCNLFDTSFGIFECLHGVGHGLLAYVDYNLPESILQCDKLWDAFSVQSCYGGMFMENVLTAQGLGAKGQDHATSWANREDPYFPCNKIDQRYELQYACYQMQTSWMLTMYNYDFDRVTKECLRAPENMRSVCFKSLGRDAAGYTLRKPTAMKDLCDKVPRTHDYYEQCIIGGVNVIVDFWGPDLNEQASEFCTLLEGSGKETCYLVTASRLLDLFNDQRQREAVCATFEQSHRHMCANR